MKLVRLRVGPGAAGPADPSTLVPGDGSFIAGDASLVDRQERTVRYLRMSLTDRCSMRCTYCMPPEGIDHVARSEVLSLEEVAQVAGAFARWGVERVRLTGGEPTLRRGLELLVERLAQTPVGYGSSSSGQTLEVALTTNGERLEALAEPLRAAGLGSLTVSMDSLDDERFAAITRRDRLPRVRAGVAAAAAVGFSLKINTVAIQGFNHDELAELCRFAWDHEATPRLIELMPMAGGRLFVPGELMAAAAIREAVREGCGAEALVPEGRPSGPVGPAHYWRLVGGAHDGRRFGTIAAMTENFCDSCNRLRVSATGQLHACLARDDAGDLRAALRGGVPGQVAAVVAAALGHKRDTHDFGSDGSGGPQKAMISIGG